MKLRYSPLFFALLVCVLPHVRAGDAEALLALKESLDAGNSLPWRASGSSVCEWEGVKECTNGRVTKLVLEHLNLSGVLSQKILNRLDQLRVLSFKGNSLSGEIPDLSGLVNLKSLYLSNNNFSGQFPSSISGLHRLKVVALSGNQISGPIPDSLLKLRRLYVLHLQDNLLTGAIPPFNQTSLRFFNVSNNRLSGDIPVTPALVRFNASSFSGNLELCGEQIQNTCGNGAVSPSLSLSPSYPQTPGSSSSSRRTKLVKIIAGSVGGFVGLLMCILLLCMICKCRERKSLAEVRSKGIGDEGAAMEEASGAGTAGGGRGGNNGGKQVGFSWESEGLGSLVFCGAGDQKMTYSLEDLLKASAETLGRGTIGSTYKAVMESGYIVTVKRLKDARYPRAEEFGRQMEVLGRLRHPNLVPLRAYFQAKEERLLVYDYFPNGSLFSLIHGK